jgi:hypothetical protein
MPAPGTAERKGDEPTAVGAFTVGAKAGVAIGQSLNGVVNSTFAASSVR